MNLRLMGEPTYEVVEGGLLVLVPGLDSFDTDVPWCVHVHDLKAHRLQGYELVLVPYVIDHNIGIWGQRSNLIGNEFDPCLRVNRSSNGPNHLVTVTVVEQVVAKDHLFNGSGQAEQFSKAKFSNRLLGDKGLSAAHTSRERNSLVCVRIGVSLRLYVVDNGHDWLIW